MAGDHVLPTITPHISGLSTFEDPLKEFFVSLDEAAALPDVKQALPAHGHPFADLAGRCDAIKRHHDERLEKVREISRLIGAATVDTRAGEIVDTQTEKVTRLVARLGEQILAGESKKCRWHRFKSREYKPSN